jgi:hypothetical protein
MSVCHLIYRSVACYELSPAQLTGLLEKARAFNQAHLITGILLYGAGQFMQVLEGEESGIEQLYGRIRQDERHEQVQTLTQGVTGRRVFPRWSMGFLAASPEEFNRLVGHLSVVRHSAARTQANGQGLLALLQEFAQARIVLF